MSPDLANVCYFTTGGFPGKVVAHIDEHLWPAAITFKSAGNEFEMSPQETMWRARLKIRIFLDLPLRGAKSFYGDGCNEYVTSHDETESVK